MKVILAKSFGLFIDEPYGSYVSLQVREHVISEELLNDNG
jgi:hypothetical protein